MTEDLTNYNTHRTMYIIFSMVYIGLASSIKEKDSRVGQQGRSREKRELQSGHPLLTTLPWSRTCKDELTSAVTVGKFGGCRAASVAVKK